MGTLLAFAMISLAVVMLRVRQPELERPFKTPGLFIVGPLGALFNFGLMYFVRPDTWIAFIGWTTLGIVVYFLYSRKHSHLNEWAFEEALRGHDAIVNASEETEEK
jgi:APA family basic amino acid/polyamine antiporter